MTFFIVYMIGWLVVLFGARLVYLFGQYLWTREIRLKVIFLSFLSWAAVVAAIMAVISHLIIIKMPNVKWSEKVKF